MTRIILFCMPFAALGAILGYLLVRANIDDPVAVEPDIDPVAIAEVPVPEPIAIAAPTLDPTALLAGPVIPSTGSAASSAPASQPAASASSVPASQPAVETMVADTGLPAIPRPGCPRSLLDDKGALQPGTDPFLEQRMQWLLADYRVPEAAVVVLEPASGELLAAAGYSSRHGKTERGLALEPRFLAASVFKIVSAAALLEQGVAPGDSIRYSGGIRSVSLSELKDSASRDTGTTDFSGALARSLNVPFAKWADRKLDAKRLTAAAKRFGFAVPAVEGRGCYGGAVIPEERLAFARTAAGFGEVRQSAWHAAMMTAVVANRGLLPRALVAEGQPPKRILQARHAEALAGMLERTVTQGTARRAFTENGRYLLGPYRAAGKTGSLVEGTGESWREATWFVGMAPVDKPRVVVAALLQNTPEWRIRAAYVGREALRTALLRTSPYRPTQDRKRTVARKRKR